MFRSNASPEERALAHRLRREAAAHRPEFSARLHVKLCRAVRRCKTERASAADPFRTSDWPSRYGMMTAIATAALLAVTIIALRATVDKSPRRLATNPSLARSLDPVSPLTLRPPEEANGDADAPDELETMVALADRAAEEIDDLVEATDRSGDSIANPEEVKFRLRHIEFGPEIAGIQDGEYRIPGRH